jgi:3-phosphoshikimate 1-carboxyvinyltransferase
MRLLAGMLAGQPFETTLTGDASLRSRPMQRIIEPLEMMGAEIESNNGRAPLTIRGRYPLHPIIHELPVASAQVKSSILLAGLSANGHTTVNERVPTRDHTERLLCWFVEGEAGKASCELRKSAVVSGPANLTARDIDIPGDISSAAYFIAAAALLEGASLKITNVGLNPRRIAFLKVMEAAGFDIDFDRQREPNHEPVGYIRVEGGSRRAGDFYRADFLRSNPDWGLGRCRIDRRVAAAGHGRLATRERRRHSRGE